MRSLAWCDREQIPEHDPKTAPRAAPGPAAGAPASRLLIRSRLASAGRLRVLPPSSCPHAQPTDRTNRPTSHLRCRATRKSPHHKDAPANGLALPATLTGDRPHRDTTDRRARRHPRTLTACERPRPTLPPASITQDAIPSSGRNAPAAQLCAEVDRRAAAPSSDKVPVTPRIESSEPVRPDRGNPADEQNGHLAASHGV
jgi:hypothetical protein